MVDRNGQRRNKAGPHYSSDYFSSHSLSSFTYSMQYCMPIPTALMHSTLLPAVTQARASKDYNPSNSNVLNMGIKSFG